MSEHDIQPDEWYSARDVILKKFIPWIHSIPTLVRWVESNQDLFKPIIKEGKTGKRYYFQGKTLLELIKKAKKGTLEIKST